jgi:3-deoxy-D-manno-octulosonate 8-phosphate phosphatase (KDO 8-P phosphatase)
LGLTHEQRAARVKLLLADVDGVLTDGRIFFVPTASGEWDETKGFHSRDGIAMKWLRESGIECGLISGRRSTATQLRAEAGGFRYCFMGDTEKTAVMEEILRDSGLAGDQLAFIGDDLTDMVCFRRVGLAVAVADAAPEVRAAAHYVTRAAGGAGAFREVAELILRAQGRWDAILKRYEVTE